MFLTRFCSYVCTTSLKSGSFHTEAGNPFLSFRVTLLPSHQSPQSPHQCCFDSSPRLAQSPYLDIAVRQLVMILRQVRAERRACLASENPEQLWQCYAVEELGFVAMSIGGGLGTWTNLDEAGCREILGRGCSGFLTVEPCLLEERWAQTVCTPGGLGTHCHACLQVKDRECPSEVRHQVSRARFPFL